jgi:hypothetical protein
MLQITLIATLLSLLLSPVAAAQSAPTECRVEITAPPENAKVGPIESVSGTALIPPGTRLWILAHRQDLGDVWWPQGNGAAQLAEGNRWQIGVFFGEPRDVGARFEVVARVVGPEAHRILQRWVENALKTGQYPPIAMPPSAEGCRSSKLVATKVG